MGLLLSIERQRFQTEKIREGLEEWRETA